MANLIQLEAGPGGPGRRLLPPRELAWLLAFFILDGVFGLGIHLMEPARDIGLATSLTLVLRGGLAILSATVAMGLVVSPLARYGLVSLAAALGLTILALATTTSLALSSWGHLGLTMVAVMLLLHPTMERVFPGTDTPSPGAESDGPGLDASRLHTRGLSRLFTSSLALEAPVLAALIAISVTIEDLVLRILVLTTVVTITLMVQPSLRSWLVIRTFDALPEGPLPPAAHQAWRRAIRNLRGHRHQAAISAAQEAVRHGAQDSSLADFIAMTRCLAIQRQLGRSAASVLLAEARKDSRAEPTPKTDEAAADSDPLANAQLPDGIGPDFDTPPGPHGDDAWPEREFPEIALLLLYRSYPLTHRRGALRREIQRIDGASLARLVALQTAVADALVRAVESYRSPFQPLAAGQFENICGHSFAVLASLRMRSQWNQGRPYRDLGRGFPLLAARLIERDAEPLARLVIRRARDLGVGQVPDDRQAARLLQGLDSILVVYSFAEELRKGLTLDQARRRLDLLLWVVARDCGAFEYGTPLCAEVVRRSDEVREILRQRRRAMASVVYLYEAFPEEVRFEARRVLNALQGAGQGPMTRKASVRPSPLSAIGDDRDLLATIEALEAMAEGRHKDARIACEDAIRTATIRQPFLYWNLVHALAADGQRDAALAACDDLLRRAPGSDARYRLLPARILESSGALGEAEIAYRRACRVHRGRDVAHYALGRFRYEQGQYDEALREFWLAHDADPQDPDYPMAIALIHLRQGRHREARDLLEPLRNRPGVSQTGLLFLLSRTYAGMGDDKRSRELLQLASKDDKADAQTLEEIANFLEERREFSLASDFAARALQQRLTEGTDDEDQPDFGGNEDSEDTDDEEDAESV